MTKCEMDVVCEHVSSLFAQAYGGGAGSIHTYRPASARSFEQTMVWLTVEAVIRFDTPESGAWTREMRDFFTEEILRRQAAIHKILTEGR
jgi:hypothetical protein